jgi:hypothetical protein
VVPETPVAAHSHDFGILPGLLDPTKAGDYLVARPKNWDDKYGPWGTPPDYTPRFTVMTNIQSPTGLRVGGVVCAIFLVVGIACWYLIATTGEPITGKIIFGLFVLIGVCSYMTWWCFHLAKRRAKWLREREAKAIRDGQAADT